MCPAPIPPAAPQIIKQSILELKLQAEDSFVLKVVQLEELLQVRHSVFVIGNAGSGKSQAGAPQHRAQAARHRPLRAPALWRAPGRLCWAGRRQAAATGPWSLHGPFSGVTGAATCLSARPVLG